MLMTLVICLFTAADGVKLYQQRDFSRSAICARSYSAIIPWNCTSS